MLFLPDSPAADSGRLVRYQGRAVRPDSGELAYTEEVAERLTDGRLTELLVIYRNPDGQEVARKKLDFTHHPTAPDYRFDDHRDGYLKGLETAADRFRVYYRMTREEPVKEKRLTIPEPVVIDHGLNHFILEHWEALLRGERRKFNYVIPKRLTHYRLRVTKTGEFQLNERASVQFEITPDSALLKLAAGVMGGWNHVMVYDLETKGVVQYRGVSAIHDEEGGSYEVRTDYDNPAGEPAIDN
jgi:hypothetical protein